MDNSDRVERYKKHTRLEELFPLLEGLLGPVERSIIAQTDKNVHELPEDLFLIVGNPRAGSTLLLQLSCRYK